VGRFWILAGFAPLACGPSLTASEASGGGTTSAATSSDPTLDPTPSQGSTIDVAPTETSNSSDAEDGDDSAFIVMGEWGPVCAELPDGTLAHCTICDVWTQDCPSGEKCIAWASDGGTWNATRCSGIVRDPGAIGDPCTVEGSAFSGIDDCDIGAMCFHVDPETNEGTCLGLCIGSAEDPICDPGTTCTIRNDGVLTLCLPTCNPLLDDCDEGHVCGSDESDFWCVPQVKSRTDRRVVPVPRAVRLRLGVHRRRTRRVRARQLLQRVLQPSGSGSQRALC